MKIYIDCREQSKISYFKSYVKKGSSKIITEVEVGQYDVSDYHTGDGMVGIERKSSDFVSSLFNGKLDQQMKELTDNFSYPFLFIEYDGIYDMLSDNLGINPKSIVGGLTSIMARHKVTIMFTGNYSSIKSPLEPHTMFVPFTIRTIEKFYDGKNKTKEYTPIRRKATMQETKLDLISRIPNVGKTRAIKILDYFDNSINKLSNSSIEDIQNIDGIGKKIAERIYETLR